MTPIFDTHAHYDDEAFDEDREEILAGLSAQGVGKVTDIGAGIESSKTALELSKKYDWMYCALGVIPGKCSDINEETWKWLCDTAEKEEKCVAIGEIGLDYHWDDDPKDIQALHFINQMDLARKLKKPVVIHSRDSAKDTIDIMKAHNAADIGGVLHCYSYTYESAREFLNMGFYFGIGGVVTFKNAKKLEEAVRYIPLSNIVLETDCPYLAPVPHRGERCDSRMIALTAERAAEIRGTDAQALIHIAAENGRRLFGITE
jgi:TatD DNase family protein